MRIIELIVLPFRTIWFVARTSAPRAKCAQDAYCGRKKRQSVEFGLRLKGFATFWEFSFYRQKNHSLFAEEIHFHN